METKNTQHLPRTLVNILLSFSTFARKTPKHPEEDVEGHDSLVDTIKYISVLSSKRCDLVSKPPGQKTLKRDFCNLSKRTVSSQSPVLQEIQS